MGFDVVAADTYPDTYERIAAFNLPVPKIAAGADFSFTVPVGLLWNVVSISALFTASAAAANRIPAFFVKNEAGTTVYTYNVATLTANQTGTFTFSEDVVSPATFATGTKMLEPMPSTWLPSLWSFGVTTAAIDTADQWSGLAVWIQEYLPREGE